MQQVVARDPGWWERKRATLDEAIARTVQALENLEITGVTPHFHLQ